MTYQSLRVGTTNDEHAGTINFVQMDGYNRHARDVEEFKVESRSGRWQTVAWEESCHDSESATNGSVGAC